eukprot:6862934-Pyramimonas_sp.AAC.1
MRPLQLPTCIRRLCGASLADLIGPAVEPLLSPNQAAKRGGQCGPNITKVTGHLSSPPSPRRHQARPGPRSWGDTPSLSMRLSTAPPPRWVTPLAQPSSFATRRRPSRAYHFNG